MNREIERKKGIKINNVRIFSLKVDMKGILFGILIIGVFCFDAVNTHAQCDCVPNLTLQEHFQNSDAVFVGRVVETKKIRHDHTGSSEVAIKFEIEQVWKQDLDKFVIVREHSGSTDGFEQNARWLLYAFKDQSGTLQIARGCCSRTKPISVATKQGDLKVFKKMGAKPKKIIDNKGEKEDAVSIDKRAVIEELENILKASIPEYTKFPSLVDQFFIYDLTDPSNKYLSGIDSPHPADYIDFVDGHIYHFSVSYLPFSRSHIGIYENGKWTVFRSINCENGSDNLQSVIRYVSEKSKKGEPANEVLTRLMNYRSYGFYKTTDETKVRCNSGKPTANVTSRVTSG